MLAPLALAAAEEEEGTSNFLVPNGTFFVELGAFALLFYLLARYVIPPINDAMTRRQEAIRKEFAELEAAKKEARGAEEEFKAQIADARKEAARIREEAREQGAAIIAEMREQANAEAQRILSHAQSQLQAERQQVLQQVRAELGTIAITLAERILGQSLQNGARQQATVEQFIAELESQRTSTQTTAR